MLSLNLSGNVTMYANPILIHSITMNKIIKPTLVSITGLANRAQMLVSVSTNKQNNVILNIIFLILFEIKSVFFGSNRFLNEILFQFPFWNLNSRSSLIGNR